MGTVARVSKWFINFEYMYKYEIANKFSVSDRVSLSICERERERERERVSMFDFLILAASRCLQLLKHHCNWSGGGRKPNDILNNQRNRASG